MHTMSFTSSTSLDDLTLAFLDVETTGLSARHGDRVCEVAIVRSRLDLVQATFQSLVNPERPISPGASAVNHLSDEDVRDAPRFSEVADTILATARAAVLVCHNAPFDLGFIATEMRRAQREFVAPVVIDTLALARQCYTFKSNSLSRIASALGIPTPDAHRALGDAVTTREIYLHFVEDFWQRGIRTLGELLSVQGGSLGEAARPARLPSDLPLPPTIAEAMEAGKRLYLAYVDGKGEKTERWVTPQEITANGDTLYLVAFCHLRDEVRQFRLDRIIEIKVEVS
jgi:DNA polymerase-3 subunit epsilon